MFSQEQEFRFGGILRLYGKSNFEALLKSHFLIIGIGGVGSWTSESLARSGVGKITLVDFDDICVSNTNRQIHTTSRTVGKMKAPTMGERLKDISPDITIEELDYKYSSETHERIVKGTPDIIIDCMDSLSAKCFLINECFRSNRPLITMGGSAGKSDPLRIRQSDLSQTHGDRLLHKVRKKLRQDFDFPRNLKAKWGISSIFSDESPYYPVGNGEVTREPESRPSMPLDCSQGMGSVTHVTGSFGFAAAHAAIELLLQIKNSK